MRNFFRTFLLCSLLMVIFSVSAYAAEDTLKVGLRYGSDALFSANLQNVTGYGWGYEVGYFDSNRDFVTLGRIDTNEISMTASGTIYVTGDGTYSSSGSGSAMGDYHVQLDDVFSTWEEAKAAASAFSGGYPAYINGSYRVRIGAYTSKNDAAAAQALYVGTSWTGADGKSHAFSGTVTSPSATGVTMTVTGTQTILFQFDCSGAMNLGVRPLDSDGQQAITWFKGYKYYGSFEYLRTTGGNLTVINVLPVDDYVKGVVPYEMSPSWPVEALAAQAVCARTYAMRETKHRSDGFDVCNTTNCQVYYGVNKATEQSDRAVEETAGLCLYYNGKLIEAVYSSSNGGASEDAKNVWGGEVAYLKGKIDPYEAMTTIPSYQYTVSFTKDELTHILNTKGYSVGQVTNVYVSAVTPTGNVGSVTFVGTSGTKTFTGESCRTIFNSVYSGRTVRSQRYTITNGTAGGTSGSVYVNGGGSLSLSDSYVISGSGAVSSYPGGETYVITGSGTEQLKPSGGTASTSSNSDVFTITGTGNGHNVGLSQYGAKAMAEQGYSYEEILHFYYTDITIQKVG